MRVRFIQDKQFSRVNVLVVAFPGCSRWDRCAQGSSDSDVILSLPGWKWVPSQLDAAKPFQGSADRLRFRGVDKYIFSERSRLPGNKFLVSPPGLPPTLSGNFFQTKGSRLRDRFVIGRLCCRKVVLKSGSLPPYLHNFNL